MYKIKCSKKNTNTYTKMVYVVVPNFAVSIKMSKKSNLAQPLYIDRTIPKARWSVSEADVGAADGADHQFESRPLLDLFEIRHTSFTFVHCLKMFSNGCHM
jgi:hypothetical protein